MPPKTHPNKTVIIVIAHARSGSNYFTSVMNQFRNIEAAAEVFHKLCVYATPKLCTALKQGFGLPEDTADDDRAFTRKVRQNPVDAVDLMLAALPPWKNTLYFKAFTNQLSAESLTHLIEAFNCRVIFLDRNPIEAYVSFKKAMEMGVWVHQDSTVIKPRLSLDAYKEWTDKQESFLQECAAAVQTTEVEHARLTYEDHINRIKLDDISPLVAVLEDLNIPLAARRADQATLTKQDKKSHFLSKISNPVRFCFQVMLAGRSHQIFGTFQYPIAVRKPF